MKFLKMLCHKFEYNTHYTLYTRKSCKTWLICIKKIFANNAKQIWQLFTNDVLRNVVRNDSNELCQFTTYNFEWGSSLMKTYEEIDFQKWKFNRIFIINTVCIVQKNGRVCHYIKKKRFISFILRIWMCM